MKTHDEMVELVRHLENLSEAMENMRMEISKGKYFRESYYLDEFMAFHNVVDITLKGYRYVLGEKGDSE